MDASDILAPSELEDTDLLKNEDFNFDLASKSLLFMTNNYDIDFKIINTNESTSPSAPSSATSSTSSTTNINNNKLINNLSSSNTSNISRPSLIPGKIYFYVKNSLFVSLFHINPKHITSLLECMNVLGNLFFLLFSLVISAILF